eukprot:scaffold1916_cov123-Isochrysis_galbana.AAC.17
MRMWPRDRTFACHLDVHAVAVGAEKLASHTNHVAGVLARVIMRRVEACSPGHCSFVGCCPWRGRRTRAPLAGEPMAANTDFDQEIVSLVTRLLTRRTQGFGGICVPNPNPINYTNPELLGACATRDAPPRHHASRTTPPQPPARAHRTPAPHCHVPAHRF